MSSEPVETFPWMTEEYFKSILAKYEGRDNLQLREFNVGSGTNKGENFASAIFRVSLNYLLDDKPKEVTLILKANSQNSAISDMLEEMGTFDGETQIYEQVLGECKKLIPDFHIAPR